MVYVRLEAFPSQVVVDRDGCVGAFVNCWIDTDDLEHAESEARRVVAGEGWTIVTIEECRVLTRSEFTTHSEHVAEAEAHGGSFDFHTWPASGEPHAG